VVLQGSHVVQGSLELVVRDGQPIVQALQAFIVHALDGARVVDLGLVHQQLGHGSGVGDGLLGLVLVPVVKRE